METSKLIELQASPVVFREEDHTYWLGDKQLQGVTSTILKQAFPNKYKGIRKDILDKAASRGHDIHSEIEFHDNLGTEADSLRLKNYERLKAAHGLRVIDNEYLVSDLQRFASCIDIVTVDAGNRICLVDTKTTYSLDRESTALQLSVYRRFFEAQNPGLKVARLYALWLPQRDETIAEMVELQPVDDSYLDAIIAQTVEALENPKPATDEPQPEQPDEPLPDGYEALENAYDYWADIKADVDKHFDEAKAALTKCVQDSGLKRLASSRYTCSVVAETHKKVFDEKAFRAKHEDLYNEFLTKDKVTKSYITIKSRNNG